MPAAAIAAPSPSHFVRVATDEGAQTECPRLPAPQECLLRGKGFVDAPALWRRSEAEHCSWAEARKRILWEADSLHDLPLTPSWKRRLLQNFSQALTFSQPGRGHYGRDKACMRQRAGCATCARVVWIEDAMPCYLFRECPERILQDAGDDSDSSAASCGSATEQPADACCGEHRLLRDDSGYYVRSAEDIDKILGVAAYARAWPHIPLEELHASSVQHPGRSDFRWLLNTRRAPTWNAPDPAAAESADTSASAFRGQHAAGGHAAEQAAAPLDRESAPGIHGPDLPPCAGIADPDVPVWLCHLCTKDLCKRKPCMPVFALVNWNWGGRLHPLYADLSIAMQALLGLAILVRRMIILRYTDKPDEQERGFTGNTILLAQPSPDRIMEALPPAEPDVSRYLSVCFNSQTTTRAAVGTQKALQIDPEKYVQCARLRQAVCPVFAGVSLDEERLRQLWPEAAVPTSITAGAQPMDTLHTFTPNLDGPASLRAATCVAPSGDEHNAAVVADADMNAAAELGAEPADAAVATEHGGQSCIPQAAAEAGLPVDAPAEFLIGVQECDTHDPVDRLVAFQKSLELVHEVGGRLHALATQRGDAAAPARGEAVATEHGDAPDAAGAAAALAAERATHAATLVDLRTAAQSMGANYQSQLEEALASARMENAVANTPQTLHVKSGKPVNAFEPQAWPAAFVQFFYGDCTPNLDRPKRIPLRHLFKYLIEREELQYSLASDATDLLVPGGC